MAYILKEDGYALLKEDGYAILLERVIFYLSVTDGLKLGGTPQISMTASVSRTDGIKLGDTSWIRLWEEGRQLVVKVVTRSYRKVWVITSSYRIVKAATAAYRKIKAITLGE